MDGRRCSDSEILILVPGRIVIPLKRKRMGSGLGFWEKDKFYFGPARFEI